MACRGLLITEEELRTSGYRSTNAKERLKAINEYIVKKRKENVHTKINIKKEDSLLIYKVDKKDGPILSPNDVYQILENMSVDEATKII